MGGLQGRGGCRVARFCSARRPRSCQRPDVNSPAPLTTTPAPHPSNGTSGGDPPATTAPMRGIQQHACEPAPCTPQQPLHHPCTTCGLDSPKPAAAHLQPASSPAPALPAAPPCGRCSPAASAAGSRPAARRIQNEVWEHATRATGDHNCCHKIVQHARLTKLTARLTAR